MARPPNSRRSKDYRKPVTIDLEAEPSGPGNDEATASPAAAEPVAMGDIPASDNSDNNAQTAPIETPDETGTATQAFSDVSPAPGEQSGDASTIEAQPASGTVGDADDARTGGTDQRASPPPVAPPAAGGGRGRALAAGVGGGVVALALWGGLQWLGFAPVPGQIQSQPVAAFDPAPLQAEIDALKAQLATATEAAPGSGDFALAIADAAARADAAQTTAAKAETAATEAGAAAAKAQETAAGLANEIAALKNAVSGGAGGEAPALEALASRADALEKQVAGLRDDLAKASATPAADPAMQERLAALEAGEAETGKVIDRIGALEAGVAPLAEIPQRVDALGQSVAAVGEEVKALGERISKAEESIAAAPASEDVARAVAATALSAAINRGGPFASELETFAGVAPDAPEVATLRQYAATGVPTQAMLVERFDDVAYAISASKPQGETEENMVSRLMSSARSLVKVRPVGEVEGDTQGAIAARMEVALKKGDLAAVVGEWDTLPDHAKAASQAFIGDVKARIEVDGLTEKALGSVLTGNG